MMPAEAALRLRPNSVVVFDLDDTLYQEREFVRSGLRAVANHLTSDSHTDLYPELWSLFQQGEAQLFDAILQRYQLTSASVAELLRIYREHDPQLHLPHTSERILAEISDLGIPLGLLTDGRSVTQRNKIRALGIERFFDEIVVSEEIGSMKPDRRNFLHFESRFSGSEFSYIGDNLSKDFVSPNSLGWQTVGLKDRGQNIHSQDISVAPEYLPQQFVNSLGEIRLLFHE